MMMFVRNTWNHLTVVHYGLLYLIFDGCPCGLMVKAIDCGIVGNEFEHQFTLGQIP